MNEKTAEALEASIKHWEKNLELAKTDRLTYVDIYNNTCALCHMFIMVNNRYCDGCPVQLRTGRNECRGTPWLNVYEALNGNGDLIVAVEAELNFLKSLREEQP